MSAGVYLIAPGNGLRPDFPQVAGVNGAEAGMDSTTFTLKILKDDRDSGPRVIMLNRAGSSARPETEIEATQLDGSALSALPLGPSHASAVLYDEGSWAEFYESSGLQTGDGVPPGRESAEPDFGRGGVVAAGAPAVRQGVFGSAGLPLAAGQAVFSGMGGSAMTAPSSGSRAPAEPVIQPKIQNTLGAASVAAVARAAASASKSSMASNGTGGAKVTGLFVTGSGYRGVSEAAAAGSAARVLARLPLKAIAVMNGVFLHLGIGDQGKDGAVDLAKGAVEVNEEGQVMVLPDKGSMAAVQEEVPEASALGLLASGLGLTAVVAFRRRQRYR